MLIALTYADCKILSDWTNVDVHIIEEPMSVVIRGPQDYHGMVNRCELKIDQVDEEGISFPYESVDKNNDKIVLRAKLVPGELWRGYCTWATADKSVRFDHVLVLFDLDGFIAFLEQDEHGYYGLPVFQELWKKDNIKKRYEDHLVPILKRLDPKGYYDYLMQRADYEAAFRQAFVAGLEGEVAFMIRRGCGTLRREWVHEAPAYLLYHLARELRVIPGMFGAYKADDLPLQEEELRAFFRYVFIYNALYIAPLYRRKNDNELRVDGHSHECFHDDYLRLMYPLVPLGMKGLTRIAEVNKDPIALFLLCYYGTSGLSDFVVKEDEQANQQAASYLAELLRIALEQPRNDDLLVMIALCMREGRGEKAKGSKVHQLLTKAKELGNPFAATLLGTWEF